jgi:hypothetical protein
MHRSENDPRTTPANEPNSQETLADSLVQCLGVEGAIYACRDNAWDGVLSYVLMRNTAPGPAGR